LCHEGDSFAKTSGSLDGVRLGFGENFYQSLLPWFYQPKKKLTINSFEYYLGNVKRSFYILAWLSDIVNGTKQINVDE